MGTRKYARKDIADLIQKLKDAGWRVDETRTYPRAYCPCGRRDHQGSIHLTPNQNYAKRRMRELLSMQEECQGGGGQE